MKRLTALLAVTCAGLLMIDSPARAQSVYEITVDLDDSVKGELNMIKAVLGTADLGEASSGLRGMAAKLNAEFQVALSDRISDTDVLTLDDGGQLLVVEGDEIKIISKNCKSFPCAGATIVWGKGHGRPMAIFIRNASGECVKAIRWGMLKGTRRPHVSENCGGKEEEGPIKTPEGGLVAEEAPAVPTSPEAADVPGSEDAYATRRDLIDRRL